MSSFKNVQEDKVNSEDYSLLYVFITQL